MDRADWQTVLQIVGVIATVAGTALQWKWRRDDRKRRDEDDDGDEPEGRHRK